MKTVNLLVWTLTLCLAAAVNLPAQDTEDGAACSVEMIKGDYAFVTYGLHVMHEDSVPVSPGNHVGVWRADGEGNITGFHNTKKTSRDEAIVVTDLDAGKQETTKWGEQAPTESTIPPFKFSYTVEPNCQGTMSFTAPNGTVVWQSRFVVLNGGREAIYTVVVPHNGVAIGTFRRLGDFDRRLEARVAVIEDLVKRMAAAMYVISPKDAGQ